MTNNSEKQAVVAGWENHLVGQAPPLQKMLVKSEPAWVIQTEQSAITKFIVIDNKRISVTLEDFRGDIEITIKKQEFIEEEWEFCEANIFTPIEIQALTKLLASLGSLIPVTQKTNSEQ